VPMPRLQPDDQARLDRALKREHEARGRHEAHRRRWEHFYALWRSYKDLKRDHLRAKPRDVDEVLREGKRAFGESLFIPYVFSIIESTLPRMLSEDPKMLVTPQVIHGLPDPDVLAQVEDNVANVTLLFDVQQRQMRYPLTLQDVAKSGLVYGLGVQKLPWCTEKAGRKKLVRPTVHTADGPQWVEAPAEQRVIFDGPKAEAVDIFDFLWDPYASSIDTARFVIHRTWRDEAYVRRQVESGVWTLPAGVQLKDLCSMGGSSQRDELWQKRERASGFSTAGANETGRGSVHEVWELHDDGQIMVVVDRAAVVLEGANPYWHGELPFQIFRPTRVPHEFAGIGEAEAIEDLVEEMNELRTSRRDNARLALQRPFAYFDGLVEPGDIAFGPGIGIPVDGDPREAIFPIPLQDIPASGYQEEANLSRDIERVSGIDDTQSGSGGGAAQTATGVQLVQAAAGIRIQNKTKLLEIEVVGPAAQQMLALNQQKITQERVVPGPPRPMEDDRPWSWYTIGPEELAGEYVVAPIGGSMAPENVAQKRNDATLLTNMMPVFQGVVDPQKVAPKVLELLGIDQAKTWLVPQEPTIPAHVIEQVAEALRQMALQDPHELEQLSDPHYLETLIAGAMAPPVPGDPSGDPMAEGGQDPAASAPAPAAPDQPAPQAPAPQ
jgi:hypothetical protein